MWYWLCHCVFANDCTNRVFMLLSQMFLSNWIAVFRKIVYIAWQMFGNPTSRWCLIPSTVYSTSAQLTNVQYFRSLRCVSISWAVILVMSWISFHILRGMEDSWEFYLCRNFKIIHIFWCDAVILLCNFKIGQKLWYLLNRPIVSPAILTESVHVYYAHNHGVKISEIHNGVAGCVIFRKFYVYNCLWTVQ